MRRCILRYIVRLRLDFNNNERQTSKEIGTENNFRFPIILVTLSQSAAVPAPQHTWVIIIKDTIHIG